MAENKKSFVLYANITHTVKKLTKVQIADLFLTILDYVNDENPVVNDFAVDLVFEPIRQQLKIDLKKWEDKVCKYSNAGREGGLKSGEARREKANEAKRSDASPTERIEAVNVNVSVNDIVNDTVNVNESKKENLPSLPDLSNSNLYRQPTIPTKQKVYEVFKTNGGTKEMADKFWDNNTAAGWYYKSSPIVNFSNLVPGFIKSWNDFDKPKQKEQLKDNMPYNRKVDSRKYEVYDKNIKATYDRA